MFETTVVESKKQKFGIQKYLTLPVSLGLHVVVIVGMIFGAVWNVEFPENSPAQAAQYSVAAAPPPPPPPPPPEPPQAAVVTESQASTRRPRGRRLIASSSPGSAGHARRSASAAGFALSA